MQWTSHTYYDPHLKVAICSFKNGNLQQPGIYLSTYMPTRISSVNGNELKRRGFGKHDKNSII